MPHATANATVALRCTNLAETIECDPLLEVLQACDLLLAAVVALDPHQEDSLLHAMETITTTTAVIAGMIGIVVHHRITVLNLILDL